MKKILALIVVIAIAVAVASANNNKINDVQGVSQDKTFSLWQDTNAGIRLVVIHKLKPDYYFSGQQQLTLKELASQQKWQLAINSGFFLGSYTKATPAGLLVIKGQALQNLAPIDTQVTRVVSYKDGKWSFSLAKDYVQQTDVDFAFQVGPMILENGLVQTTEMAGAANGTGEYKRAFLGVTDKNEAVVGITTSKMSLAALAEQLTQLKSNGIDLVNVVNMDGGQSTSLFVATDSSYNHNSAWFLPQVIGFR